LTGASGATIGRWRQDELSPRRKQPQLAIRAPACGVARRTSRYGRLAGWWTRRAEGSVGTKSDIPSSALLPRSRPHRAPYALWCSAWCGPAGSRGPTPAMRQSREVRRNLLADGRHGVRSLGGTGRANPMVGARWAPHETRANTPKAQCATRTDDGAGGEPVSASPSWACLWQAHCAF